MKIPPSGINCPHCGGHITADPELVSSVTQRRRRRDAQYASIGKRCSNCHAYQPLTEFNRCAARADGFQSVCRSCSAVNLTLRVQGGPPLVRLTRAALQAKNDAVNRAAGRK